MTESWIKVVVVQTTGTDLGPLLKCPVIAFVQEEC